MEEDDGWMSFLRLVVISTSRTCGTFLTCGSGLKHHSSHLHNAALASIPQQFNSCSHIDSSDPKDTHDDLLGQRSKLGPRNHEKSTVLCHDSAAAPALPSLQWPCCRQPTLLVESLPDASNYYIITQKYGISCPKRTCDLPLCADRTVQSVAHVCFERSTKNNLQDVNNLMTPQGLNLGLSTSQFRLKKPFGWEVKRLQEHEGSSGVTE